MSPDDLMIETRGLAKSFGKLVAVNGIDLKVHKGHIHGFVGPNGAGKTTTIKMLVGDISISSGQGYVGGFPIGSIGARKQLGYSPERPCFYSDMKSWEYIVYMAGLSGLGAKESEERAYELLHWWGLERFWDTKIGGFSAGMKQRLSLAQAMAHNPELLVLDEPTANLDPEGRISLLDKLRQLSRGRGATIFISSHILPELEQLVDAVTVIDKGVMVAEDSVDSLKLEITANHYILDTYNNGVMVSSLRMAVAPLRCIQEMHTDASGVIHITSGDVISLQDVVMGALKENGIALKYFGEEQVSLQDVYKKAMKRD